MKVALIGASGNAGSRILKELVDRGHQVTAIARDSSKIPNLPKVRSIKADANDEAELTKILTGHEAVISSLWYSASDPALLIRAVKASGAQRYLVVGGAGSLDVQPGVRLYDTSEFNDEWKPEARKGGAFLDLLRAETDLDWTFLSPSAAFVAGERTGKFRLGKDQLLKAQDGDSRISFEDYAVAMVDELENPRHTRQRFTVGY